MKNYKKIINFFLIILILQSLIPIISSYTIEQQFNNTLTRKEHIVWKDMNDIIHHQGTTAFAFFSLQGERRAFP